MIDVIIPCMLLRDRDRELTAFFLKTVSSLMSWPSSEWLNLIIVDNGSQVDEYLLRDYAHVYVRNRQNLGYGPAVNQGLKLSTAHMIMVINNDLNFGYGDWPAAAATQLAQPGVGIVSSHLIDHDLGQNAAWGEYPAGHLFGACWAISREVLERVGLLDEQFERGMFEDKDYAYRVREAGYAHHKAGWVAHVGNATWGKLPNQQEIFIKNRDRFNLKWRQ